MKSRFKKISHLLLITMVSVLLLTACGQKENVTSKTKESATSTEFKKTTLRFGSTSAEGSVVVETMKDFADRVSKKTDGKVVIQIFPSSQLGGVKEMTQSLQLGALDMSMTQPASLVDMGVKEMSALVLPYIFRDFDHRWNVLAGEVGNSMLEKLNNSKLKLKGIGYFKDGARSFFTNAKKPISKFEDVKGLKIRVQPYQMDSDMVSALGGNPTPTASSELYSALQSGVVDGADQPIAGYYSGKYYEVAKSLTLDEHTYNTLVVLFSQISWDKLEPQAQKVIMDSWNEAEEKSKAKILSNEVEVLKKIESEGVKIIKLTDRDKWVAAMKPVYDKHGVGFEDLISKIKAVK
ncbi:TRAP transporter substrate-binding protein [Clostridium lacusfryxellense]|uniref:TRAP transporter substrate-binding protein n=1 Tax=Clostridium lacusfryxellense TaxID=205328 RepID=UPI001C0AFF45|nr:TRAP transporter substrate-binding protein [Clostridium lacusfryxellense]MBU3113863.1 TRAP transporter substrate-binding protein [Clostridium lacusfryxellense]